jgi:hypothetical protein
MLPERKSYEKKLDAQLAQLATQIDRIKTKVQRKGVDTMIRFDRIADSLLRMHDEASHHLGELQAASDEAWESVKSGTDKTWLEIKSAFKRPA